MAGARAIVEHLLRGHEPYPAIAVDRHWNMVAANDAVGILTEQVGSSLLEPPINVIKIALHPDGLAPQIVNFGQWRDHIIERLDHQIAASGDSVIAALRDEVAAYPSPYNDNEGSTPNPIAIPLILDTVAGRISFLSTITIFGTPIDVTLSELAIEAFFPADAASAELLRKLLPA